MTSGRLLQAVTVVGMVLFAGGMAAAQETADSAEAAQSQSLGLWDRDTLTDNWFGLGEKLEERGITVGLGLTQVYQFNTRGGLATARHAGRYAGSYDLEIELDFEQMANLKGLRAFILSEGSWSDGIDDSSVGSLMGVNDDAGGDRSIDVTELWFELALLEERLIIRAGKISLTGGFECSDCPVAFDGNAFANDETMQFLASPLVNNPTIPFPDNGLGMAVYVQPTDWWYVAAAGTDAQADARLTGFSTAFGDEDYYFGIFETGVTPAFTTGRGPLQGAYRVGFWYDPQPKDRLDGGGSERDDVGLYTSLDQMLLRENEESDQGLGLFARFGWANHELNEIKSFWSTGVQYRGLVPSRDSDVLAFGVAQGRLSRESGDFTQRHETIMEMYYNAEIAPWLSVAPHIQYVIHPGGADADDAMVAGVRVQIAF
ncbi:MAG: carbohydrate porin [Planctomycetes bacterium]|nr:carbohydrate porin [Planctomycetota bacterium]